MTDRVFNVLFLCTGNSARSILAESILRKDGAGHFRVFSAGSHPKGQVNPLALKVLASFDYPTEGLRSKPWDEFAVANAPVMDFVFTVCDDAAGEVCPVWPGKPITAHWGIPDPSNVSGTDADRERAFVSAFKGLKNRISLLVALPLAKLETASLVTKLRDIGTEPTGVTIYHNPNCGTSRNTLALIRNAGIEPTIIEYLKTPPSRAELVSLITRMGISVRDLLRRKGTPYDALGLDNPSLTDDDLIDAMMAHPILMNRPIVVTPLGVALCRPSEAVLDILPNPQRGAFVKEDGEKIVDESGKRIS